MAASGYFSDETVAEARNLIASGISESAVLTQYRVKWGHSQEDAERLYRIAERESGMPSRVTARRVRRVPAGDDGTKDLIWGFAALAVGGVISAITWIMAEPGGTYFLLWGPIIFGGYRLVKGFMAKFRTSANTGAVMMWLVVAVLMGGGIVIAGTVAFTAGRVAEPSDSEFVWTDDDPVLVRDDVIRFSGRIENANDTWTIANPILTLSLYNSAGQLVSQRTSSLDVPDIGPNRSAPYSIDVTLREQFAGYEPGMEWEWVVE